MRRSGIHTRREADVADPRFRNWRPVAFHEMGDSLAANSEIETRRRHGRRVANSPYKSIFEEVGATCHLCVSMAKDMENEAETAADSIDDASVLVVLVNNARDWEAIQREGWYRIPVKRAPRQVGAEYLAFFHTAAIEELKWSVHYYAPVQSMRVAPRRQLLPGEPDHPRANDLYYRVDLGPLTRLERPVRSRRLRRVTFIHTTLARLLEAEDVSGLWIKQPLRERLWVEFQPSGHSCRAARRACARERSTTSSIS